MRSHRIQLVIKIRVTRFFGSAIIRSASDSVDNFDKLTFAGNLESLAEINRRPRYVFEQVDICDSAGPNECSIHASLALIGANVIGTLTRLKATRQYWPGLDDGHKDTPNRRSV